MAKNVGTYPVRIKLWLLTYVGEPVLSWFIYDHYSFFAIVRYTDVTIYVFCDVVGVLIYLLFLVVPLNALYFSSSVIVPGDFTLCFCFISHQYVPIEAGAAYAEWGPVHLFNEFCEFIFKRYLLDDSRFLVRVHQSTFPCDWVEAFISTIGK